MSDASTARTLEADLLQRLDRIEKALDELVHGMVVKDFYSVDEVAKLLGRSSFTVREWCRHGRVRASKRSCGRGRSREWMIANEELVRIRSHGLLPLSVNRQSD